MEKTKMSKIKDYTLDHPGEVITGTDKPKKNPYAVEIKRESVHDSWSLLHPKDGSSPWDKNPFEKF